MSSSTDNQYWSMTEGVFNCLIDKKRTVAFQKAIYNTVSSGDVVIDMGTGSGILAMTAAKAGAKKVYAVEIDVNNIRTLEETFRKNNLHEVIEVIHGDIRTVKIPEEVDVVIGEMIATGLIEELQVPAMNHIFQYTKPSTKILLNRYESFVDLVYNKNEYYGFEFEIIRYEYPDEKELESVSYTDKHLLSSYDFSKKITDLTVNRSLLLPINSTGTINAIRLSGKTTFYDNSTLDGTFAYDYPLILPIEKLDVAKGSNYQLNIQYVLSQGLGNLHYSLNQKQL